MSYMYLTEQGSQISVKDGTFVVLIPDGSIRTVPIESLESIVAFGNISITTPCIQQCLLNGIPISFLSAHGRYFGRLESTSHTNTLRLRKQISLSENMDFRIRISKKLLSAKCHNQRVLLMQYARQTPVIKKQITMMKKLENGIQNATKVNELKGYEGSIAREYFSALRLLVTDDFKFNGRSKQPPKDAFNSMLSLGYTLLLNEIQCELVHKKLNPYIGFLHEDRHKHPTLASDLMEEWRSVIVDSTVVSLIRRNEISIDGFWNEEKGVFLEKDTLKVFLAKLEARLRKQTNYISAFQKQLSFRNAIRHQAQSFALLVDEENIEKYEPIRIR